ncbi:MAG: thioredoxin-like protein [Ignavibacteria bacterium]|nr:MAG: thioredoxin-like protein [Ignavibacteria bacterium]KAF0161486.1 MAG: thioredoxin-like protein [Ignavibacteria bacterium]
MKSFFFIQFLLITSSLYAQLNKTIIDEKSGKQILIGICDRTAFADSNYSWWFNAEYENYEPDSSVVEKFNQTIHYFNIKIVMASWCGDSKREVPRFFKIIDAAHYDCNKLQIVSVDRTKQSSEGEINNLEIKFVPTFIFFKGETELGRIIEMPKGKLEEDILEIVCK